MPRKRKMSTICSSESILKEPDDSAVAVLLMDILVTMPLESALGALRCSDMNSSDMNPPSYAAAMVFSKFGREHWFM